MGANGGSLGAPSVRHRGSPCPTPDVRPVRPLRCRAGHPRAAAPVPTRTGPTAQVARPARGQRRLLPACQTGRRKRRCGLGEGPKGFRVIPQRWVVERAFAWLGQAKAAVQGSGEAAGDRSGHDLPGDGPHHATWVGPPVLLSARMGSGKSPRLLLPNGFSTSAMVPAPPSAAPWCRAASSPGSSDINYIQAPATRATGLSKNIVTSSRRPDILAHRTFCGLRACATSTPSWATPRFTCLATGSREGKNAPRRIVCRAVAWSVLVLAAPGRRESYRLL